MTAVVQREQSTTMASMGGFGNNIIVSHRIHRGSQTGARSGRTAVGPAAASGSSLVRREQAPPTNAPERLAPSWGSRSAEGADDVFDGVRVDEDSLPGPSSSSPSPRNSFHGDLYSR